MQCRAYGNHAKYVCDVDPQPRPGCRQIVPNRLALQCLAEVILMALSGQRDITKGKGHRAAPFQRQFDASAIIGRSHSPSVGRCIPASIPLAAPYRKQPMGCPRGCGLKLGPHAAYRLLSATIVMQPITAPR
jgi:hypothetical protein